MRGFRLFGPYHGRMAEGVAGSHEHSHSHSHGHSHSHSSSHQHVEVQTDSGELLHFVAPSELDLMSFDAFGVPMAISAPAAVMPRVQAVLPPSAQVRDPREGDDHIILSPFPHSEYRVVFGTESISASSDVQIALEILGKRIREHVALSAPDHTFVHAGVVGHNGRAIVVPGLSFAGKTTLVGELVRAGATYYSDEFAVLDGDGLVHPYAKPLSVRNGGWAQVDHDVASYGGTSGVEPLPIGVVALTWYERDAGWAPERLSTGEGTLKVLANTVPASDRPAPSLAAITKALGDAVILEGSRGEASAAARELLSIVSE
jgi:hypothetical protein